MKSLMRSLANPERQGFDSILVAGSKGKGSTALMMQSILTAQGLKVGLYTSPHLVSWSERICIDGEKISSERAVQLIEKIQRLIANMPVEDKPSYFELTTAMAFMYFAQEEVDVAVLEVGMGGRWDATNVVENPLSVITPIGFEHEHILGPGLKNIAREKCGIIRGGGWAVSSQQTDEAGEVILSVCEERKARLSVTDEIQILKGERGCWGQHFELLGPWGKEDLQMSPLGEHQLENARLACLAVRQYAEKFNRTLSKNAIKLGLLNVRTPGRMEIISKEPVIVLDGSHNGESAQALARGLKEYFVFDKLFVILGMLEDKDPIRMFEPFREFAHKVWLTHVQSERSFPALELRRRLLGFDSDFEESCDLSEAMSRAKGMAQKRDLILVTGSLYLVGEAKALYS